MRVSAELQLSLSLSSIEREAKQNSLRDATINGTEIPTPTVWDTKKIFLFISMAYANFCLATCFTLPAPFFPHEAEKKGASPSIYGLIFGVYQLTNAFMSPIVGKLIPILGPRFVVVAGIFLASWCSILFGLLDRCPAGVPFIALSFCVRMVEAIGVTAYITATYGVIPIEFSGNIGKAVSVMETAFGLGMIVGPTVGGVLYQFGGYELPFIVMGALLLTGALATFLIFPQKYDGLPDRTDSILSIINHPSFLVDMGIYFTCFLAIGFNEATLEPHIRQFHLQPYLLGLVFMVNGLLYSLSTLLWGYLSDKGVNGQNLSGIGSGFCAMCFLLIGPAPFFCFNTSLHLVIFSQVMLGIGIGAQLLCSYVHGTQNLVERGFPANISTYSMYSGIMAVVAGLGAFVGPSVGGILLDHTGYRMASFVMFICEIILVLVILVHKMRSKFLPERSTCSEKSLLLRDKMSPNKT